MSIKINPDNKRIYLFEIGDIESAKKKETPKGIKKYNTIIGRILSWFGGAIKDGEGHWLDKQSTVNYLTRNHQKLTGKQVASLITNLEEGSGAKKVKDAFESAKIFIKNELNQTAPSRCASSMPASSKTTSAVTEQNLPLNSTTPLSEITTKNDLATLPSRPIERKKYTFDTDKLEPFLPNISAKSETLRSQEQIDNEIAENFLKLKNAIPNQDTIPNFEQKITELKEALQEAHDQVESLINDIDSYSDAHQAYQELLDKINAYKKQIAILNIQMRAIKNLEKVAHLGDQSRIDFAALIEGVVDYTLALQELKLRLSQANQDGNTGENEDYTKANHLKDLLTPSLIEMNRVIELLGLNATYQSDIRAVRNRLNDYVINRSFVMHENFKIVSLIGFLSETPVSIRNLLNSFAMYESYLVKEFQARNSLSIDDHYRVLSDSSSLISQHGEIYLLMRNLIQAQNWQKQFEIARCLELYQIDLPLDHLSQFHTIALRMELNNFKELKDRSEFQQKFIPAAELELKLIENLNKICDHIIVNYNGDVNTEAFIENYKTMIEKSRSELDAFKELFIPLRNLSKEKGHLLEDHLESYEIIVEHFEYVLKLFKKTHEQTPESPIQTT